jgi:hypothetical protein
MLEAAPDLTPSRVKQLLLETAEPIRNVTKEQQGFGVPNARAAVERALKSRHEGRNPGIHIVDGKIYFLYSNRVPRSVCLAGDFNGWDFTRSELHETEPGFWSCWVTKPARGDYRYKFVIDERTWTEDPANPDKEPDGFGGWNSRLTIAP